MSNIYNEIEQKILEKNLITQKQFDELKISFRERNFDLYHDAIEKGWLDKNVFLSILSNCFQIETIDLYKNLKTDQNFFKKIPVKIMRNKFIIPIFSGDGDNNGKLILAMSNPLDIEIVDEIQSMLNLIVKPIFATKQDISISIEKVLKKNKAATILNEKSKAENLEDSFEDIEGFNEYKFEAVDEEKELENIENIANTKNQGLIIEIVNKVIFNAILLRASDIHIEPYEKILRIRYRIDGILKTIKSFDRGMAPILSARIKIMSDLNIAERRLPQDGRIKLNVQNRSVDFRISIIPTIYGEKIVMRILDNSETNIGLEKLGMIKSDRIKLERAAEKPHGMILITGPTGSGKTTSLYSLITKLNNEKVNISTVEDPVEYRFTGVNQINCKEYIGLTFANILRSFLRQDPDVIMVGEIRDEETAAIATRAALTGHLLFSTLHTNDAPSAIQRLIDMKIEPYLLASSLLVIQAQRLARKICTNCKEEIIIEPHDKLFELLKLDAKYTSMKFYKGKGCEKCNETGYLGRIGFFEILEFNNKLKEEVAKGANTAILRSLALKQGMRTLRMDGIEKAVQGLTTLDEVLRVTIGDED